MVDLPRSSIKGFATLMIHPDDAAPRGIAAGDEVRVRNARGAFFAVADVTDLPGG
jgi:biotin/methionine sulfoxide reductase